MFSWKKFHMHYCDIIMSTMASKITSVWVIYSNVCSGPDQRKHQSSASLAFVRGIHRWPANSPHKGTVTRGMFPFDYVIMWIINTYLFNEHVMSFLRGHKSVGTRPQELHNPVSEDRENRHQVLHYLWTLWRHGMDTLSALLILCAGTHR